MDKKKKIKDERSESKRLVAQKVKLAIYEEGENEGGRGWSDGV